MKFAIPPEVMAGIIRRYQWRLVLSEMSRSMVNTPFDEHYFAVSAYGPYPRDAQILSFRTVAKMLRSSPSDVQFDVVEHRELVRMFGVCRMCRFASSVLKRGLEREREEAEGGDLLVVAQNASLMIVEPPRMPAKVARKLR